MDICFGGNIDKEAAKKNREIEQMLKNERRCMEEDIKLLLLGTGGSGKSTIAKQMKIIHLSGFPENERIGFKGIIFHNVITAIVTLIEAAEERNFEIKDQNAKEILLSVPLNGNDIKYSQEIANATEIMWAEKGIKNAFELSHEFQLDDSAGYFLDNCKKFCTNNYIPEECDILRARAKTTGIVEINFIVNKKNFTLVDVGGQRNERKKWIHCFQDVTSVIYCVAMNEYDLLLEEDNFTNRMVESLKVFQEVINSPYFIVTPIILFLNKKDLFEEKVKRVDLSCCFPQYEGGLNYDKGSSYIKKKFESKNNNRKRKLFAHFTTATDTSNVRFVFRAVEKMIIDEILGNVF